MTNDFLVVRVDRNATEDILDEETAELDRVGARIIACDCRTEDDVILACRDADVITTDGLPIGRKTFAALPRLKAVIRRGVGYDLVDVPAATEHGVLVVNVPDFCGEEVSNHVIMLMLAYCKKLLPLSELVRRGAWAEAKNALSPMAQIHGQTIGIIGCGRIGQKVARKAACLGMRVIGYDKYLPEAVAQQAGITLTSLDELLSRADYITLHVALTEETKHMINAERLGKMKRTAVVINTSRGPAIDEAALYQALAHNQIAGACLDVFEKEPPDVSNPLFSLSNIIVMPHSASYSDYAFRLLRINSGKEAARIADGMMPRNVVNKEAVPRVALRAYEE